MDGSIKPSHFVLVRRAQDGSAPGWGIGGDHESVSELPRVDLFAKQRLLVNKETGPKPYPSQYRRFIPKKQLLAGRIGISVLLPNP
jgi:hypothetical protein